MDPHRAGSAPAARPARGAQRPPPARSAPRGGQRPVPAPSDPGCSALTPWDVGAAPGPHPPPCEPLPPEKAPVSPKSADPGRRLPARPAAGPPRELEPPRPPPGKAETRLFPAAPLRQAGFANQRPRRRPPPLPPPSPPSPCGAAARAARRPGRGRGVSRAGCRRACHEVSGGGRGPREGAPRAARGCSSAPPPPAAVGRPFPGEDGGSGGDVFSFHLPFAVATGLQVRTPAPRALAGPCLSSAPHPDPAPRLPRPGPSTSPPSPLET